MADQALDATLSDAVEVVAATPVSAPPTAEPELDDNTILRLTQEIKDTEAAKSPLVGEFKKIEILLDQYDDVTFRSKIKALGSGGAGYRPIRGDGNCAWRAFGFRYFELVHDLPQEEISKLHKYVESRNALLDLAGYHETAYGDFVEETLNLFGRLPTLTSEQLLEEFNNPEISSAIVVHFRLLAAAYVKTHGEDYAPFIDDADGTTVDDYCSRHIEAFAVEADHLALSAFVNAMPTVSLGIVYMDRSDGEEAVVHHFSSIEPPPDDLRQFEIDLLYRPGHYDIFYR
ncbi:peptidase C65 Otubain-domain-containing protein [Limtongia smithiae]|uniref:peptidase C65 Otubain-domain-containing protein n=1 Tax=Limtongia smithiae TaxID=1125753 RepID=UPI0034CF46E9